MAKNVKKVAIIDLIALVLVAVAIAISMRRSLEIELALGLAEYREVQAQSSAPRNAANIGAGELRLHFVDVGQGDCTIIEFPDGKTMIIDGGENNKKTEAAIDGFIKTNLGADFRYFDYAVLTHADSDHCGSLDYVLENYPAQVVFRPNVESVGTSSIKYVDPGKADLDNARTKSTAVYYNAIKAMYAANADFTPKVYVTDPADPEQSVRGGSGDGEYTFDFFSPLSLRYTGEGEWNNYSPVMILGYRGFYFAMSGDAEERNLDEFVKKVSSAASDGVVDKYDIFTDSFNASVVKAGHHGSRNATTSEYLDVITAPDAVRSSYCVISCGEGNSYGHPHREALDRYAAAGFADENILRTDVAGDITFSVAIDETGAYTLRYGDKSTDAPPVKPDPKPEPEPEPEPTGELVLVYVTLGGIELRWPVVAWTMFGVLFVLAVVHTVLTAAGVDVRGDGGGGGKNGKNGKSGTRRRKR